MLEVSERQPTAPKMSHSYLECLDHRPEFRDSLIKYNVSEIGSGLVGIFAYGTMLWTNRRPLYSGIYMYPVAFATGYFIMKALNNYWKKEYGVKVQMARHYISLHPEDFPSFEQVQYKDVFKPWTPYR